MPQLDSQNNPTGYLTDRAANTNRMVLMMQSHPHWVRSGFLDQNVITGELRDRYMYDGGWPCIECRPYLEKKEGARIIAGFDDHEMWVTVTNESMAEREHGSVRDAIRRRSSDAGIQYVAVPSYTGKLVVLTTGPFDATSEAVDDQVALMTRLVMPIRWKFTPGAGISSTRGFLPPARPQEHREAFRKNPPDRCWHLHPPPQEKDDTSTSAPRNEAKECANILSLESADGAPWYTRWTSIWHSVGEMEVRGEEALRAVAEECGIEYQIGGTKAASLLFEPLMWNDPRFVRLRKMAGWTPPRPDFIPPTLELQYRIISDRGLMTARPAEWKKKSG